MPRNNSNSIAKDALRQYIKTNKATPSVAVQLASLRLEYSELSHTLNQYIKKMRDVERIYPRSLPTQASGRWSTIDPPLTNFPKHCISPECPQGWHEKTGHLVDSGTVCGLMRERGGWMQTLTPLKHASLH